VRSTSQKAANPSLSAILRSLSFGWRGHPGANEGAREADTRASESPQLLLIRREILSGR
jgi:hypothetical protein